jgi:hypothetical protein
VTPVAASDSGDGVIAGGGGRGAPLFSRPKPQSRGRTPGGTRVLKSGDPIDHSATRRGADRAQSSATVELEATAGESGAEVGSTGAAATDSAAADRPRGPTGEISSRRGDGGAAGGEEVTGTLVGSRGAPAFGAPGLHGGTVDDQGPWAALGIAGVALLIGLVGAGLERRRGITTTATGAPA